MRSAAVLGRSNVQTSKRIRFITNAFKLAERLRGTDPRSNFNQAPCNPFSFARRRVPCYAGWLNNVRVPQPSADRCASPGCD